MLKNKNSLSATYLDDLAHFLDKEPQQKVLRVEISFENKAVSGLIKTRQIVSSVVSL